MADDNDSPKDKKPKAPPRPDDVVTGGDASGVTTAPKPTEDIAAPQIAPEQPQEPNLGQPAMPESVLGTDVAPGAAIPPDKMKQAEHLATNPNAEAQFRGKQEFHDTMRGFGEREATNRASMVALNPNDPDYLTKLANHQAQEGMLKEAKSHYQQSHPWGSIESAHPGILGKIGHAFGEIGNVAGEALAPNVMPAIPGSQANLAAKAHAGAAEEAEGAKQGQEAATTEETQARIPELQAETALKGQEETNLENKPEGSVQNEGKTVTTDQGVMQWNPDTKRYDIPAGAAANKVLPHVTYDSGIPVSVTDGKQVYDVNDPKLPPALKPLVDAATRAHGQRTSEEMSKQAAAFAHQDASAARRQDEPTNSTKTMIEAAPKVISFVDKIDKLIDDNEKGLGPMASRWREFKAGKVGFSDPAFTRLRTDVGLMTTLLMRMHVGARGGEYIMKHFQDLVDSGKQSPDNLRAALGEIRSYAQDVAAEKAGGAPQGGGTSPTPAGNGAPLSVKDWLAQRQAGANAGH